MARKSDHDVVADRERRRQERRRVRRERETVKMRGSGGNLHKQPYKPFEP